MSTSSVPAGSTSDLSTAWARGTAITRGKPPMRFSRSVLPRNVPIASGSSRFIPSEMAASARRRIRAPAPERSACTRRTFRVASATATNFRLTAGFDIRLNFSRISFIYREVSSVSALKANGCPRRVMSRWYKTRGTFPRAKSTTASTVRNRPEGNPKPTHRIWY